MSTRQQVGVAPLRLHRGWLVLLLLIVIIGVGRPICLVVQALLRAVGRHPGVPGRPSRTCPAAVTPRAGFSNAARVFVGGRS